VFSLAAFGHTMCWSTRHAQQNLVVICLGVAGTACGDTAGSSFDLDASNGRDQGSKEAGPTTAHYDGVVLATVTQSEKKNSYGVYADFVPRPRPIWVAGASQAAGAAGPCSCASGLGDPCGSGGPPDAGRVTVESTGGATLAALTPASETQSGSSFTGSFFGTPDLGVSEWSKYPGSYDSVGSLSWTPGESLRVAATGDQIHSFSGSLKTGALLAGVSPAMGAAPVTVERSRDLEVSWTPVGSGNDEVVLVLEQITGGSVTICTCSTVDSSGHVGVESKLLTQFQTEQQALSSTILLGRTTTTSVSGDNATIALVSENLVTGKVVFE
jgi:hypothetical protein